jgi:hypothetical protein
MSELAEQLGEEPFDTLPIPGASDTRLHATFRMRIGRSVIHTATTDGRIIRPGITH